ncbi:AfsR/SARP family transcriptional regulator [Streptosporangium sp. NPDC051022]|uniref:AfsR/SARP family transcriptional regulator n=1 Tax=Streptosporangium sp. NPDC051022 TaxID=3155752 RepID=UPI00341777A1
MEFRLLGPVEVMAADGAVPLGGVKPKVLLAALLLEQGRVVPTDRLIDIIWPDDPPETARAAIQTYVKTLRQALARAGILDVIVTRAPGYLAQVPTGAVDVGLFERHVADARQASTPEETSILLEAALALWRGPALAGLGDSTLAGEAARLEQLRLTATEERITADLALGRHGWLVAELASLVERHPDNERLRGQYMTALYRLGRQSDALASFREGRRILAEELGVDPGPELTALHHAILRGDPALLTSMSGETARVAVPAQSPLSPADFTGRSPESSAPIDGKLAEDILEGLADAQMVDFGRIDDLGTLRGVPPEYGSFGPPSVLNWGFAEPPARRPETYTFSDDRLTRTNTVRKPTSKKPLPLDGQYQPYSGDTQRSPCRSTVHAGGVPVAPAHHQIPRALLHDPAVPGLAVAIWCRIEQLMSLNDEQVATMSREKMAAEFGVSPATLDRARQVLIKRRWLACAQPDRTGTTRQRVLGHPRQTGQPYAHVPAWALTHVVNPATGALRRETWCPRCCAGAVSERLETVRAAWRCAQCWTAFYAVTADEWRSWAILVDRADEGDMGWERTGIHKWVGADTVAQWWNVSLDTVRRRFAALSAALLVTTRARPGKSTVWQPAIDADDAERTSTHAPRAAEDPTPRVRSRLPR